jgi:hypothetical protein
MKLEFTKLNRIKYSPVRYYKATLLIQFMHYLLRHLLFIVFEKKMDKKRSKSVHNRVYFLHSLSFMSLNVIYWTRNISLKLSVKCYLLVIKTLLILL